MTIAFVAQNATGGSVNGVTSSTVNTTGANLIVLSVSWGSGGTPTISDSKTNSWTKGTTYNSSVYSTCLWYCLAPATDANHTFTASISSGYPVIGVIAVSGVAASSPYDQHNGSATGSASTLATGSITPSQGGCLVVSSMFYGGGNYSSVTESLTVAYSNYLANTHYGGAIGYIIQTSAAAVNPSWTISGASQIATAVASFLPAAGGASGGPFPFFTRRRMSGGMITLDM